MIYHILITDDVLATALQAFLHAVVTRSKLFGLLSFWLQNLANLVSPTLDQAIALLHYTSWKLHWFTTTSDSYHRCAVRLLRQPFIPCRLQYYPTMLLLFLERHEDDDCMQEVNHIRNIVILISRLHYTDSVTSRLTGTASKAISFHCESIWPWEAPAAKKHFERCSISFRRGWSVITDSEALLHFNQALNGVETSQN